MSEASPLIEVSSNGKVAVDIEEGLHVAEGGLTNPGDDGAHTYGEFDAEKARILGS